MVQESRTENPIVLVQDYHFALLPRMIRERLPQRDDHHLLAHSLAQSRRPSASAPGATNCSTACSAASILGFHTQFHCNNFLDTVDRYARGARRSRNLHASPTAASRPRCTATRSRSSGRPSPLAAQPPVAECRARGARASSACGADVRLGIGVDRLDYTKGILERFAAVERLLELEPRWIGRFAFVQIAAPSRSSIEEYQSLDARVRARGARASTRASARRATSRSCCKIEHHDADRVYAYYRAADVCFVTSLHDGMNLVAKEFVAARDDERGVLILSQFTGAARELPEALIVNPYDTEQCAAALRVALDDAAGRAARPHAQHAQPDPGVQRLPLGRAHAARRGAHAQPPARRRRRAERAPRSIGLRRA